MLSDKIFLFLFSFCFLCCVAYPANGQSTNSHSEVHLEDKGTEPSTDIDVEERAFHEATSSQRGVYGWVGVTSGAGPDPLGVAGGPGGGLHVALSYRFHWVEPEVVVETGFFGGQYQQRFAFGCRFILPFDDVRPFFWLAFNHTHETSFENVLQAPVQAFLSSTGAGTAHLSGVESGIGVLLPIDVLVRPDEEQRYDVLLRASVVYLPAFLATMGGGGRDRFYFLFEASAAIPFFEGG
ncbi:MAG: hypothetical protein GY822_16655 [Deltaproteobacteria bacterium]|nr:hypothetical protein [Deltaproteobacteria bacterium]